MKLNKLASAVSISLAALALTACGGSDDDAPVPQPTTPTQPTNPTTPPATDEAANIAALVEHAKAAGLTPAQAEKFANENKALVAGSIEATTAIAKAVEEARKAATGDNVANNPVSPEVTKTNPFIDGFDSSKLSSVSTAHYERHLDSNYDRVANPSQYGSSGNSTTYTTNDQNPYLSNYVLGIESFEKDEQGNPKQSAVDVVGAITTTAGVTQDLAYHKNQKTVFQYEVLRRGKDGSTTKADVNTEALFKTLQAENEPNVEVGDKDGTNAAAAAASGTAADTVGLTGLVAYSAKSANNKVPVFGLEENAYKIDAKSKELVVNNPNAAKVDNKEVANNKTTRIFGKNYQALENGAKIDEAKTTINSYVGAYDAQGNLVVDGVKSTKLHNVQYGRLTNNIDVLAKDPTDELDYVYRDYLQHGADTSVDTYFYRGTNETTLAQMEAVKAKGGVLNYRGHALTYNLGPIASTGTSTVIPTAYGNSTPTTIGNFVQANFDTATNKVDGSIYNFLNKNVDDAASKYTKQDLVTFTGDVHGNTVVGTSTKLGATPETGSLTASFYGANAEELGGNVSSITRSTGYDTPKWGAVFGASRVVVPTGGSNFSTGSSNGQNNSTGGTTTTP